MKSRKAISIAFVIVVYSQSFPSAANEDNNSIASPEETVRNFYSLFLHPVKRDDQWFKELQEKIRGFVIGDLNDFVNESCGGDYFIKGQDIADDWLQKMRILSVHEDTSRKAQVIVGYGSFPSLIVKLVREGEHWKINSVLDSKDTQSKRELLKQNFPPASPATTVVNFYKLYINALQDQKYPCRSTLEKFVTNRCLHYRNLECFSNLEHSLQEQERFQILKSSINNGIAIVDFKASTQIFGRESEVLSYNAMLKQEDGVWKIYHLYQTDYKEWCNE